MSDATWKAVERRVGRLLGGKRTPLSGAAGGADVTTPWCVAEVKTKRRLPNWLKSAMQQAQRAARDGQLPLVVLHQLGQRHANDLVLMRLCDFVDWFGPPTAPAADGGASGTGAEEDGD